MATQTNTTVQTSTAKPADAEPKSSTAPIESVVVQKFYDDNGALIEEGRPYQYFPKKDKPYPWPILRPKNEDLADELKAEYDEYHARKMDKINARSSIRGAFESLANMREE